MRPKMTDLPARPLIVEQRRRRFGLDAARLPDIGRIEREILGWLEEEVPEAVPLRAADIGAAARLDQDGGGRSSTLVLLLPCRRTAVLRLEARPDRPKAGSLRIADACLRRNIPLAVVSNLDETRAALRRWGFEPKGR